MDIIDYSKDERLKWLRYVLRPSGKAPAVSDWHTLYDFADKQKIIGVCDPTRHEVQIDLEVLSLWMGAALQISDCNTLLNKRAVELWQVLKQAGFRCCILKGQGNAEMYPNPLSRMPGDIDVWIDAEEDTIQRFVRERFPDAKECFKHIKFPLFDDVEVDVHQTPLKLRYPQHQRRLQGWIDQHKEEQFNHFVKLTGTDVEVAVPTARFNAVYQLGHIMIHLFDQGVGFRQLIDYFYVLKELADISLEEREKIVHTWKMFGMSRLASAVMWIESDVLGLHENYLLVTPNRKLGERLLADVLEGGNFGHYSTRQSYRHKRQKYKKRISSLSRLIGLAPLFPSEAVFWIMNQCIAVIKHDIKKAVTKAG